MPRPGNHAAQVLPGRPTMEWAKGQTGWALSRRGASGRRLAIAAGLALLGAFGCDRAPKTDISKTTEFAQTGPLAQTAHGQGTGQTCVTIRRGLNGGVVADTEVASNNPTKNYGDS